MSQCVWCKKEDCDPSEWTKDRELLCGECAGKYKFGLARGMIGGQVSALSKEQRRAISQRFNTLVRFIGAMRSIEKEQLAGQYKTFESYLSVATLPVGVLLGGLLVSWIFPDNNLVFVIYFPSAFFLALFINTRAKWLLKYAQLKNDSGFVIDFMRNEDKNVDL